MKICESCNVSKASLIRPKTRKYICLPCFFQEFEDEIHYSIVSNNVFKRGERVAIGASGGKDSTVLAHTLNLLNKKYDYGLDLFLLSIDEGITGYRDDSLETVKSNEKTYGIPLTILSYEELYGWTMDKIVSQIGRTNNCTFCGVFRRQALERGAMKLKADKIAIGHNADDIAETVLINILRGDYFRLGKCVDIVTGGDGGIPRCKPFKYTYEKEIVMYAYHKKLEYFSTECVYSPFAYRGHVRDLIKNLESVNPQSIMDIIHSGEQMTVKTTNKTPVKQSCSKCGFISSNTVCKACVLLERLDKGKNKVKVEIEEVKTEI